MRRASSRLPSLSRRQARLVVARSSRDFALWRRAISMAWRKQVSASEEPPKVFDRHPGAKLLLGHMGEGLPYALWRMDSRWAWHNHRGIELDLGKPSEYVRRNIYITT